MQQLAQTSEASFEDGRLPDPPPALTPGAMEAGGAACDADEIQTEVVEPLGSLSEDGEAAGHQHA